MASIQNTNRKRPMSERAKAAYKAYSEAVGGKSFSGEPLKKFEEMPAVIRKAWDAACLGAMDHWLENMLKPALRHEEFLSGVVAPLVKIGRDRGDAPLVALSVVIGAAVLALIHDDIPTYLAKQKAKETGENN